MKVDKGFKEFMKVAKTVARKQEHETPMGYVAFQNGDAVVTNLTTFLTYPISHKNGDQDTDLKGCVLFTDLDKLLKNTKGDIYLNNSPTGNVCATSDIIESYEFTAFIGIDDFPEIPDIGAEVDEVEWETARKLLDTLHDLSRYVSDDPTRFFLSGVCVNEKHTVATDGRTLKLYDTLLKIDSEYILRIPKALIKTKTKDCFAFRLHSAGYYVETAAYDIIVYSHIEGKFPNYRKVIPELKEYEKLPMTEKNKAVIDQALKLTDDGIVFMNDMMQCQTELPLPDPYCNEFSVPFSKHYFSLLFPCKHLYVHKTESDTKPMVSTNEGVMTLVMPLRK